MVALASSFGTQSQLLPEFPPVYVAGVVDTVAMTAVVVFDTDLDETVFDVTKMFFNPLGASLRFVNGVLPVGNVISGAVEAVGGGAPTGKVNYVGFPTGLFGANTLPVENFFEPISTNVPVPMSAEYSVGAAQIDIVMSENIFINTATKTNFSAVVLPNTLNIQSVAIVTGNVIRLGISVDGPGSGADRVEYDGQVDGIEDAVGNDVPVFVIGLDIVP